MKGGQGDAEMRCWCFDADEALGLTRSIICKLLCMWSEHQEAGDRGASQKAELAESPDGAVDLAVKFANAAALSALANAGCTLDSTDKVPPFTLARSHLATLVIL